MDILNINFKCVLNKIVTIFWFSANTKWTGKTQSGCSVTVEVKIVT